jgi:DNA-directed RNA polymerase subunit F
MANITILEETPLTMTELKEDLKKVKKRDEELSFRGNKTEEYLNLFVTLKPAEVKELTEKLEGLNIPRLRDIHFVKIIDLLPPTIEELKVLISGYNITINNDNCKKIVDLITPFCNRKMKSAPKPEVTVAPEADGKEESKEEPVEDKGDGEVPEADSKEESKEESAEEKKEDAEEQS